MEEEPTGTEYRVVFIGPAKNEGSYHHDGTEEEALDDFTKMLAEGVGYGMFKILEFGLASEYIGDEEVEEFDFPDAPDLDVEDDTVH